MKDKVILVDADGVLLDWEYAFDQWMKRHGYTIKVKGDYLMSVRYGIKDAGKLIRMFNESAWVRKMPPLRDAIHYVRKLHQEHGYVFHVITSLSDDEYAQHLRTKNLRELFGDTVFEKYVYLDTGADKDLELVKYKDTGCYWVEDKPENAHLGHEMGLRTLLMSHDHNLDFHHSDIRVVKNWQQIYHHITA